jgi:hypothetical protein
MKQELLWAGDIEDDKQGNVPGSVMEFLLLVHTLRRPQTDHVWEEG